MDTMYNMGCFSTICSFTLQKIADTTNLSIYKIRDAMKLFINLGLVNEGARDVRAKTYFLSEKGIQIVKENKKVPKELKDRYLKMQSEKGE
jgi:predicted transcriptional regulator